MDRIRLIRIGLGFRGSNRAEEIVPTVPMVEVVARVELARARGHVLAVSQNHRCYPAARRAAGLVADRALGAPLAAFAEAILTGEAPAGEVFRSALTWTRGRGKVFYFRPGQETYPTYRIPEVQAVIARGCRWAAPCGEIGAPPQNQRREPIERLPRAAARSEDRPLGEPPEAERAARPRGRGPASAAGRQHRRRAARAGRRRAASAGPRP